MTRKNHEINLVAECIVTTGISCGYCAEDKTGHGGNRSNFARDCYDNGWRMVDGLPACPSCAKPVQG